MKLIIHITKHIQTIEEGAIFYREMLKYFADDPAIHVNAIADHNFKHPELPDNDQTSNPFARQNNVTTENNPP